MFWAFRGIPFSCGLLTLSEWSRNLTDQSRLPVEDPPQGEPNERGPRRHLDYLLEIPISLIDHRSGGTQSASAKKNLQTSPRFLNETVDRSVLLPAFKVTGK